MELVIAGIGGLFVGLALAEKLGLALLQAYYIPFTPTQAYPSFLFPKLPSWFRGRLNRLSYHVVRQIMWQGFRSADRLARQKVLGLPSAPFWGPYGADCLRHYTVFMVDSIPFSWLFSRVAAVVHHGGAGTTSAGLRAGVPSVVIPFFGDQPFWGQRVAELGGGPEPIPRRKLTVERLAQAIQRAVTDQTMRQRAAELGARIRAEDGVACAVDVVQRIKG
jgi:hypothetical protein